MLQDVNGDYHKSSQRDNESTVSIELQTAPIRDGVLPGVVRQVILECVPSLAFGTWHI